MRLREERRCLQPTVLALPYHPLVVLLRDLQIFEQHAFELVGAIRVLGHLPEPVQSQGHVSLPDRLAKRSRSTKISMGQLFDFTHAELLAGQRHHEVFDVLFADAVHAHELPQGVHVGVNREIAAEEFLPHRLAHLPHQAQPHAHPGFAPRQLAGDVGDAHGIPLAQFFDEAGLFQNGERAVVGDAQQRDDRGRFVFSQRRVGGHLEAQLRGASITLESVEQNASAGRIHALQSFLDAALGDRGQQARLHRRIPHPIAFVPQIQCRQFHAASHLPPLRTVFLQLGHNIVHPAAPRHAVLSHRPRQPPQHLGLAHTPTLNQTRHHCHIAHHAGRELRGSGFRWSRGASSTTPNSLAVLDLLLGFAFRGGVVGDAALGRASLAMRLAAAKGTAQVAPPGVAGVGQKEDPAMPATPQTAPQVALAAQQGPQHDVILQHQSAHFALAIPIRTEVEMPLDLDYDKPRVSLIIQVFITSLSYPIDAPVSRG